jgi:glutamine synthetase adenylyltransferase
MRVKDPADPRRCKYAYSHEQCWNQAAYGSDYCPAHGGKSTEEAEKKRLYHLAEVDNRRRLAELSDHESVKSLREEIGLLRMLIEKRFNMIRTEADYQNSCASLNSMFLTLERLIKSCHSLEQSLGNLLSKQSVARLCQEICEIIIEELQYVEGHEEIIDRIVQRLFPAVQATRNDEPLKLTLD